MKIQAFFITAVMMCVLVSGAAADTTGPLDTLKAPIDKVIAILNDPKFKNESQRESQRDLIWESVQIIFNFKEMSQRTVAKHWRVFKPDEKKEFIDAFSRFLGNTYMDKLQGEYQNEEIVYVSQEIFKNKYALAKTKILRESLEIPVDYKMKLSNDRWEVYDVSIEGVSLVQNYRKQFNKILLKESPAQLIEKLRDKNSSSK